MRLPFFIVCMFMLIVIIIPLSVVSHNGNCLKIALADENSISQSSKSGVKQDSSSAVIVYEPKKEEKIPVLANMYSADYFEILNQSTQKIEKVSVTDYIRGAVAAEMPPTFHTEALKAQAVAAHTYALYNRIVHMKNPPPELGGADFSCDPDNFKGYVTKEQFFKRYGDKSKLYWDKICQAADSVSEYVLTYNESPIIAAYHSTSAGMTERASNVWIGDVDYLVPVESKGDILSPDFETVFEISATDLKTKLMQSYDDIALPQDPADWIKVINRSEGGYVLLVDVGNLTLTGKDIREVLNLRSSNFTISFKDDLFTFSVCGYGHGVGLSQYGADYMARQGSGFEEILKHYYKDVKLMSSSKKV